MPGSEKPCLAESLAPMQVTINQTPGIVTIVNANTTVAYCRYNDEGEVEYIFVNAAYRRKGYAKQLLALVESRLQRRLSFQTPISPLGATLQRHYSAMVGIGSTLMSAARPSQICNGQ